MAPEPPNAPLSPGDPPALIKGDGFYTDATGRTRRCQDDTLVHRPTQDQVRQWIVQLTKVLDSSDPQVKDAAMEAVMQQMRPFA